MTSVPIKPHKGKTIYCIVNNTTGEVLGAYWGPGAKSQADEVCPGACRVETYVQKPKR